jgi:hypothetical protein
MRQNYITARRSFEKKDADNVLTGAKAGAANLDCCVLILILLVGNYDTLMEEDS